MSVGEFTASNIAVDQDIKDAEKKKGTVDYSRVEDDIEANKALAKQVLLHLQLGTTLLN